MNSSHLYIKNMVCNRCIKVVKEELEKLGLEVRDIKLGEARVKANDISLAKIQKALEENGFELLEDKHAILIDRIKTIIIELTHHNRSGKIKGNFSDYLSKETGKDYHFLSHLFSSTEGITIEKYAIHQRIEKAKELLMYGELTLSEISYELDYSSVGHLSSQFKQVTGMSPSAFKKLGSRNTLDQV